VGFTSIGENNAANAGQMIIILRFIEPLNIQVKLGTEIWGKESSEYKISNDTLIVFYDDGCTELYYYDLTVHNSWI